MVTVIVPSKPTFSQISRALRLRLRLNARLRPPRATVYFPRYFMVRVSLQRCVSTPELYRIAGRLVEPAWIEK